uniref:Olfactory receptor 6N1-like n=1 Tax=Myripristis murdjan TaxID=586833 RepID=A0A667YSN4_9TELE
MENSSLFFNFNLTMFVNIGSYRYPAFVFCLLLFAMIVSANLVIILVISQQRTLHEPMYFFIVCLSINSLYGSAGFFPRFLMDLLSDTHLISHSACYIQIYVIYTYACNELTILSVMAYDRYVAICQPLHYHTKMTLKTVSNLAAFAWICSAIFNITLTSLTAKLPLCGNKIHKVFCAMWNISKLSCVTTVINNIVGLLLGGTTVSFVVSYVFYTYIRIILVCRRSSSEFKGKALQSCLPHTVTFLIYSITGFSDVALSRVNIEQLNPYVAVILSLEFVVIPPLLNPVVYGLKLPEIRKHLKPLKAG